MAVSADKAGPDCIVNKTLIGIRNLLVVFMSGFLFKKVKDADLKQLSCHLY